MKFGEEIDSVLLKNYFNLNGKTTRSEYWWFWLFYLISMFLVVLIVSIAAALAGLTETTMQTVLNYFLLGLTAAFSLPLLGLSVRRFADAGRKQ